MFEFKASELQLKDEYTTDNGATWHRVEGVVVMRGLAFVACGDNKVRRYKADKKVVVK